MPSIYDLFYMALDKSDIPIVKQREIMDHFRLLRNRYDEKERRFNRLVNLRSQGYTQKEIAQTLKMSLRDVNMICMEWNLVRGRKK